MTNPLESFVFSTNIQKVLHFFLQRPTGRFYDREVSKLTGISRAGTNFSLRDLTKAGFIQREKRGRMLFYFINPEDPLIRQLKIMQNVVLLYPLVRVLKKFCQKMVLYGSSAKGFNQEESDFDVWILSADKEKIRAMIHQNPISVRIQPMIQTPIEWILMGKNNELFANQIETGIVLWESHES